MKLYNRTGHECDKYYEASVSTVRELIRDMASEAEKVVLDDVNDIIAWLPQTESIEVYQFQHNSYIEVLLANRETVTFSCVGIESDLAQHISCKIAACGF